MRRQSEGHVANYAVRVNKPRALESPELSCGSIFGKKLCAHTILVEVILKEQRRQHSIRSCAEGCKPDNCSLKWLRSSRIYSPTTKYGCVERSLHCPLGSSYPLAADPSVHTVIRVTVDFIYSLLASDSPFVH